MFIRHSANEYKSAKSDLVRSRHSMESAREQIRLSTALLYYRALAIRASAQIDERLVTLRERMADVTADLVASSVLRPLELREHKLAIERGFS